MTRQPIFFLIASFLIVSKLSLAVAKIGSHGTMAPKKGSKFACRSPQSHHTRSDSLLSTAIQEQLVLDIERKGRDVSPSVFIQDSPEIYSEVDLGTSVYKSIKDKVRNLLILKETKPEDYW